MWRNVRKVKCPTYKRVVIKFAVTLLVYLVKVKKYLTEKAEERTVRMYPFLFCFFNISAMTRKF